MSTRSLSHTLLSAPVLFMCAVGCVTTDVDPPDGSAGMPNTGGSTATGGTGGVGAGGSTSMGGMGTGGGGAGGAPATSAAFRCEDPAVPKVTAAGDSPLIVDFETGSLGPPSATGAPSVDFMFTGGENGGTYTYTEPTTTITQSLSVVPDRNGGQALNLVLTNATDYGGGMGMYFYPCIDASVYTGVTLWARGSLPERMLDGMTIPAGTVTINLDLADVATNSRDSVACAVDTPTDATLCTRPSATFVVSDTWTQFSFTWADFDPGNKNGTPVTPNGNNLLGINLAMDNAIGTPNTLELSIDDVAFLQ